MNTTTAEQRLQSRDIQPTAMRLRVLNFMVEYKSAISLTDLEEHFSRSDRTNMFEANPEYLDGPLTGGFGELTCHSCHFDYDMNMTDRGSLTVDGLDKFYIPDHTYELKVTIQSEQLEKGGFQMTSRFEDGSQAGSFNWDGNRLMLTPSIESKVQYIQHSNEGTSVTNPRTVEWTFNWTAPESGEPVQFNIAANAGNDDDSAFGDWIYTKEFELYPKN